MVLYTDTTRIYQPNFVRWRHRYKGVRESLKVNQEIGQYYYDIKNSDYKLDNMDDLLDEVSDTIVNGGAVDGVQYETDTGDEDLVLLGFDELAAQVERARVRIKRLEDLAI